MGMGMAALGIARLCEVRMRESPVSKRIKTEVTDNQGQSSYLV